MSINAITLDGSIVVYMRMSHYLPLFTKGWTEDEWRLQYLNMMERALALQQEGRRRRKQCRNDEMPPVYEVLDFHGLGFEHFSCLGGLRTLSRILAIGQANYPENLRAAFLVSAPAGFEPGWNWVRRALHERTQAKVHITASDGRDLVADVAGLST